MVVAAVSPFILLSRPPCHFNSSFIFYLSSHVFHLLSFILHLPYLPSYLPATNPTIVGWWGGGALGASLGLSHTSKPRFICVIVGDGTFLFGIPSSVYWISRRYQIPFLTIVLNNGGWNAPRKSVALVHPTGYNADATNAELNISLEPTPDCAGIAKASASGGGGCGSEDGWVWGCRVSEAEELKRAVGTAVERVLEGRSALVEAIMVASTSGLEPDPPKPLGGKMAPKL